MKRYAHYFLQSRAANDRGGHWDTIEQGRAYSVLKSGLAREIANDRGAEIRLVGAYHDDASGEWQYAQLFYLDQTSVDLPAVEEAEEAGSGAGFDDDAVSGFGEEPGPDAEPDDGGYQPTDFESEDDEPESHEGLPWQFQDDSAAADTPLPAFGKPERRRGSVFKTLFLILVALLLAGAMAVAVLLYLQNPAVLSLADRFGLGEYARMFPHAPAASDEGAMDSPADEPVVMPLTTGNVVTYTGLAPNLIGRWSPDNCEANYVVFSDGGYTVTRDGKTSPETVEITQTLEDDFQYYLRRSPTLIEHLQKLGPNDIQMAGSTGTAGFMASGNTIQILNRCPAQ